MFSLPAKTFSHEKTVEHFSLRPQTASQTHLVVSKRTFAKVTSAGKGPPHDHASLVAWQSGCPVERKGGGAPPLRAPRRDDGDVEHIPADRCQHGAVWPVTGRPGQLGQRHLADAQQQGHPPVRPQSETHRPSGGHSIL
ncbi:hypothetical protein AVEN_273211-1 [Araneus ventricosus]|uniref:Uncharacterized protein n=1 Tax=Araneus ventricosus TaxID=182803 RepID=A0A4Y2WPE6_ARAVE|nr:hypothetical protein AVEN_62556-1 [Araneus ventricosus]GBO38474.1 hypothetical protein AVEN_273211-1 [Araneus ventricosus]